MKLHGTVEVHVSGERILREPNFWDRIKKKFGGEPDLSTPRMRAALEATAVVEATRKALSRLGATNAVSLVIDDQVLFQDLDGKPDDLGDLFLSFSDHESVFGAGFGMLRLAVEHREAGLHLVLEVIARTEHGEEEPAARIAIAGRISDFEPRKGEDAEAYRARVEPLTKDPTLIEVSRRQFESFVDRVAEAMSASMPEARVAVGKAEAQVKKPSARPSREAPPDASDPRYDPYDRYYPHPFDTMLSVLMWSSLLSFAMPNVVVVNQQGDAIGSGQDAAALDQGGDGGGGDGGDGGDAGGDAGDAGDGGGFDGDFGGDFGDLL